MRAADEVVEFLASQIPFERLAGFQLSEAKRRRVWESGNLWKRRKSAG
jgi:hypothetical protein